MDIEFTEQPNFSSLHNTLCISRNGSFTVVHVNIRSIRKYWDQFQIITASVQNVVDVFVLTEIAVTREQFEQFKLPGYKALFFTRPAGRGGGIAVFVKQLWAIVELPISFCHAEVVAVSLDQAEFSITLIAIYRPPSNSVTQFIDELDGVLNKLNPISQVCLIGDFNIDICEPSKSSTCDYLNVLAQYGLHSGVQVPTREEFMNGKLVSSCLDHIHIRFSQATAKSMIVSQKLADHYFIASQIIPIVSTKKRFSPNTTEIVITDRTKLDDLISKFDWDSVLDSVGVQNIYEGFIDTFLSLKEKSKKVVKLRKRRLDQPWIDKNILEAIKHRDYLWSRCRRSPTNSPLRNEFKAERNRINALIRSGKRNYYRKRFAESRNMRTTWSIANELRGSQKRQGSNDAILQGFPAITQQIVDQFNSHFSRFSCNESAESTAYISLQDPTLASAFLPTLSEWDLHSLLFSCNRRRSAGLDAITVSDLCRNFEPLKHILLSILNGIIESGVFPSALKIAIVKPLFKGGTNYGDVKNYRPISIISCISQILEKHLLKVMTSFVDKFGIISSHQFGFIAGRGTQTLLDDVGDFLFSSFENNCVASAVFIDVEKAFDSISHKVLFDKLYNIGFRGPFLHLLKNFVSGRSQLVSIGDVRSEIVQLKAGVPQGSVLSPLLFNLYINDLPKAVRYCQIYQYADDTVLVSRHLNFGESMRLLQTDVCGLMDWFKANAIKVNSDKTKLLCFHNPLKYVRLDAPLFLHGSSCVFCHCNPIPFVNSVKYLGLFFDSDLSWNTHLSYICTRLRKLSCCLYSITSLTPVSVRKLLINSLAYSILRYGVTVYASCSETWHHKVDVILKGMLRSVSYGCDVSSDVSLFQYNQLPNLEALFKETVILRHYWTDMFKIQNMPTHSLRQPTRFVLPRVRTRYGRNVRDFYVPLAFNELHVSCLNLDSIKRLKTSLRCLRK